jgi:DNA invertase Pin-like site-specific DNA recombinase
MAAELDVTKLRYVLYARKSTTDEGSQVRSLADQIKDCKKHADRNDLTIVEMIEESCSAKKADQRKSFNAMLKDIKANKFDAILAWSPDRLSRNMLEGGLIINMLDEEEIKDLQFPTHHFTNDPSGKLTLGIMFSISKHFSDDLSRKVQRGITGNFGDGKSSGSPKWGYNRDEHDGLYRPNDSFKVVQEAWNLRASGATNKMVVEFLLEKGYHRMTKVTKKNKYPKKILPTEHTVGRMFEDPFYYGKFVQTNQSVDLTTIYDFVTMIDEDLYNRVQALAYTRKRDTNPIKMLEFKPLARMVFCAVCKSNKWMSVGKNLPGGSKHHVLSYRCNNPACDRSPKSVRAKFVFDALYELLDTMELSDEAYERYSKRIDVYTDEKLIKIKQEVASKNGAAAHKKKELKELSLGLGKIPESSPAYNINYRQIEKLAAEIQDLDDNTADLKEKLADPNKIKLTKDQFLNLVKSAADKMRAASVVEKDRLAHILFLNLHIDNEMALSVTWREPFNSLVKAIEMSSGGDERT